MPNYCIDQFPLSVNDANQLGNFMLLWSAAFFFKLALSKNPFSNTSRVPKGWIKIRTEALLVQAPEVIKLFPCSTQLSMKTILLINVKMPTVVGILTFISMINITSERL